MSNHEEEYIIIDRRTQNLKPEERELFEAARDGDADAFKSLVEMYESRVAATIFGMLGRCEEAEDVGQETFMRFYKAMKNFKGESSVGTYLVRIAINLSLNEIKRRQRRFRWFHRPSETEVEIESLPAEVSSINPNPEQEETKAIVQHAIQQLEPKFRSVIVLRLIDGYSTQETARILELPIGTVLSRLARAQEKLKKILGPPVKKEVGHRQQEHSFTPVQTAPDPSISAARHLLAAHPTGVG